jgi:hypothetical protein
MSLNCVTPAAVTRNPSTGVVSSSAADNCSKYHPGSIPTPLNQREIRVLGPSRSGASSRLYGITHPPLPQ